MEDRGGIFGFGLLGNGPFRGRQPGGRGEGPSGYCYCRKCGYKTQHITAKPCNQIPCPKCGAMMTRE